MCSQTPFHAKDIQSHVFLVSLVVTREIIPPLFGIHPTKVIRVRFPRGRRTRKVVPRQTRGIQPAKVLGRIAAATSRWGSTREVVMRLGVKGGGWIRSGEVVVGLEDGRR